MSSVSIQAIRELRERTQAGMTDCKDALSEAQGDMEKAVEIILKKGKAKTAKRAGRVAAEGKVQASVSADGRQAVLVEVNIETDFSARSDNFGAFVDKVVEAVRSADLGSDLMAVQVGGRPLSEWAAELTAAVGEKISVRRFEKLAVPEGKHGSCHQYIHLGGKIGVVLVLESESAEAVQHEAVRTFAEETAMQIAAMSPVAVRREQIPEADVAKQRDIFEAQLREEPKPKPEKIWPKIVEGKINKWFSEVALLEQESAQHKEKIDVLRRQAGEAAGSVVGVTAFVRYELGEGIEKKKDDIHAGVAELLEP